jgi:hypothetical protein
MSAGCMIVIIWRFDLLIFSINILDDPGFKVDAQSAFDSLCISPCLMVNNGRKTGEHRPPPPNFDHFCGAQILKGGTCMIGNLASSKRCFRAAPNAIPRSLLMIETAGLGFCIPYFTTAPAA